MKREGFDETSPQTISAPDRGRCRAAGSFAHRMGASLSIAAAPLDRGISARRRADTVARIAGQWLSDRLGQPVIIKAKPVTGLISPSRRCQFATDGYTPFGWVSSGDQRDALSIAALQLPTRYRAGCRTCLVSVGIGGAPIGPDHGR